MCVIPTICMQLRNVGDEFRKLSTKQSSLFSISYYLIFHVTSHTKYKYNLRGWMFGRLTNEWKVPMSGGKSKLMPRRPLCSTLNDGDWDEWGDSMTCKQDVVDPLPLTRCKSRSSGLSRFSKAAGCVSKWGESKIISGCWLKKLRRASHWISFSKCLANNPCGNSKKCCLQNHEMKFWSIMS